MKRIPLFAVCAAALVASFTVSGQERPLDMKMDFEEYDPPSSLVVEEHRLTKSKFPFIDIHNHSESGLLREGAAANQVSQGITTILVGPDGGSPFPISEYFAKLQGKIAPNVGSFIGHASLREQVMNGDYKRQTTDAELHKMLVLMEQAMKDGAFGLSSGLEYDTGFSASTEELIALSRIAATTR